MSEQKRKKEKTSISEEGGAARLFVDMDGTLATWQQTKYEDLFEAGYFINLPPYEQVIEAVRHLYDRGVEVYVLSAYLSTSKYALEEKNRWLDIYLPYICLEHRLFCPQGTPKAMYIKRQLKEEIRANDFLLDDYSFNLHSWKAAGGTGIKLLNGINGRRRTWGGLTISRFEKPSTISNIIYKNIVPSGSQPTVAGAHEAFEEVQL